MSDETFDDQRAAELLRLVEQDRSQVSSRRDEIRERVLGHYDELREVDTSSADADDAGDNVLEILSTTEADDQQPRRWHRWVAAAAAITGITVGAGLIFGEEPKPLVTATTSDVPTTVGSSTVPPSAADDASDLSLADGEIVFQVPEGLVVVDRSDGVLVFGRTEDATGLRETVIALEADRDDFRSRLAELVSSDFVNFRSSGSRTVGERDFMTWTLSLERADLDVSCPEVQGCVQLIDGLGESAIPLGISPTVDEVVSSTGSVVLVISDSDTSIRDDATALLEAISIS